MGLERREVYFPCKGGVACHGILYTPGEKGGPGLVMAMGFGMVKEAHADDYAPFFVEKGFTVLAFDYRYFGRSGGWPRQYLDPFAQVDDYRCAIRFLKRSQLVDPSKICVWGTSFSGGHVLTLLAFPEPGVECGIAQVPNVYSYKTALEYFGSLEPVIALAGQLSGESCGARPGYIPIVSRDGPSVIRSEEAVDYYLEKERELETFENRVTADSIPRVLAYNPGHYAELVSKPLMMVVARRDKTTPPSLAREVAGRIRAPVEILEVDGGHFDVYKPPLLERVARAEADWALRTLRG